MVRSTSHSGHKIFRNRQQIMLSGFLLWFSSILRGSWRLCQTSKCKPISFFEKTGSSPIPILHPKNGSGKETWVVGSNPSGSTGKKRTAHHSGRAVCVYVTLWFKGEIGWIGPRAFTIRLEIKSLAVRISVGLIGTISCLFCYLNPKFWVGTSDTGVAGSCLVLPKLLELESAINLRSSDSMA